MWGLFFSAYFKKKRINFFIMEAFDHFKYRILMGVLPTFPILPKTKFFRWNWSMIF